MLADSEAGAHLEIGHVSFMDVVGRLNLLFDEQSESYFARDKESTREGYADPVKSALYG